MKILVTGISGFIGSHLAAALASLGYDVIGTYRNNPPRLVTRYEKGFMGSKPQKGSLSPQWLELADKEALKEICQGLDGIIHIAGHVSDWGPKQQFYESNVLPLQHFIELFQDNEQGSKRSSTLRFFIHTSSISVHGFGTHENTSEDGPYYPLFHPYQLSKRESEDILLKQAFEKSEPAIGVIRPGNVYGPGDTTFLYPIFNAIKSGKMGYVDKGRHLTCPVFVDDLVAAYITLLKKLTETPAQVHGRVYNITGGENITWKEEMELCADSAGLARPVRSFPAWPLLIIAYMLTGLFKTLGAKKPPDITPYRIKNVGNDYHFSVARAMNELDWKPRTKFHEGIIPAAKAWQEHEQA